MEAPEKLYIDTNDNLSSSILYGFTKKRKEDDIEYIRKDVFVEKASRWIEKNIKKWYENINVHGFRGMTHLMIIQFRKYIK